MLSNFEKSVYNMRTLCEVCAKACGDCPWSEYGKMRPVDGWDAIKTSVLTRRTQKGEYLPTKVESYIVLNCPLFELEEQHRWAYEKFDREAIREQYGKGDEG